MIDPWMIFAILLCPMLVATAVLLLHRHPDVRELTTLLGGGALLVLVLQLWTPVMRGFRPELSMIEPIIGLPIHFVIEPLGLLFALLVSVLWVISSLYTIGYMRSNRIPHQTRFYCFFALAIFFAIGIAMAGNLLTLFIFYEGLTLSTFPLVSHKGDSAAKKAGRIYLGFLLSSSIVLLLPAIILCHYLAGTLEFTAGGILSGKVAAVYVLPLLLLFAWGTAKAALLPVHQWLPVAMVAPTPVSALLHAVAVVKAGVFVMLKVIVYVFGVDFLASSMDFNALLYIAGTTIIFSSVVALYADNLKRRLAYSTISQLSYVILSAVLLLPLSVAGAAMHIVSHALGKITLFFAAGAIYTASGKTRVSEMNGIGRALPITMLSFTIGSLSMIGLPPTAGFVSKWFILLAAWDAQQWFAMLIIVLSTLLNAAYFVPVIYRGFFCAAPEGETARPLPRTMLLAMGTTAILSLLVFLLPESLLDLCLSIIKV